MKKILFLLIVLTSLKGVAQSVTADPALEPMKVTSLEDITIAPTQIPLNGIIKLKVPILNKDLSNGLPAGTCKVKIGLGSKLILSPAFNLATVNTSNYFTWTAISSGGEVQITGELTANLPANFSDTAFFEVEGTILGNSTIRTNFLITNHSSSTILSDNDGTNNNTSLPYTIITPSGLPLTLTNFSATLSDCKPRLRWSTENEINTSHFEIERSITGNDWVKIGTNNAQGFSSVITNYFFLDNSTQNITGKAFYRLKMIDRDGSYKYSKTIAIINNCNKVQYSIYPNPVVSANLNITIAGFSSNITATLKAVSGEIIRTQIINNGSNTVDVSRFANGVYILSINDKKGNTVQERVVIQN